MFARFGVSRLMGEAAASPLTEARVRAAAQIGIGYTCCRAN
jgi:outer membrane scaffolding protein for murein synthesis (MipA/OmpV family)